jgi:hypothetical protein
MPLGQVAPEDVSMSNMQVWFAGIVTESLSTGAVSQLAAFDHKLFTPALVNVLAAI